MPLVPRRCWWRYVRRSERHVQLHRHDGEQLRRLLVLLLVPSWLRWWRLRRGSGTRCGCTQMMEHACIGTVYCHWCPNGAQGGNCQAAADTCDCTLMTENTCVVYDYCRWCPTGAMGGACAAFNSTCSCSTMTMNSCVAQPATCKWCPTAANNAGACQALSTTC
jgi:hypothetical protein